MSNFNLNGISDAVEAISERNVAENTTVDTGNVTEANELPSPSGRNIKPIYEGYGSKSYNKAYRLENKVQKEGVNYLKAADREWLDEYRVSYDEINCERISNSKPEFTGVSSASHARARQMRAWLDAYYESYESREHARATYEKDIPPVYVPGYTAYTATLNIF